MIEYAMGNVFIREGGPMTAGDVVDGHAHNFDHVTYISKGAARIERLELVEAPYSEEELTAIREALAAAKDGEQSLAEIPETRTETKVLQSVEKRASDGRNWVLILAGVLHRITALEDGTIYHCIYAHRTPQGDVVQEYDGWAKGNT